MEKRNADLMAQYVEDMKLLHHQLVVANAVPQLHKRAEGLEREEVTASPVVKVITDEEIDAKIAESIEQLDLVHKPSS